MLQNHPAGRWWPRVWGGGQFAPAVASYPQLNCLLPTRSRHISAAPQSQPHARPLLSLSFPRVPAPLSQPGRCPLRDQGVAFDAPVERAPFVCSPRASEMAPRGPASLQHVLRQGRDLPFVHLSRCLQRVVSYMVQELTKCLLK